MKYIPSRGRRGLRESGPRRVCHFMDVRFGLPPHPYRDPSLPRRIDGTIAAIPRMMTLVD